MSFENDHLRVGLEPSVEWSMTVRGPAPVFQATLQPCEGGARVSLDLVCGVSLLDTDLEAILLA